MACRVDAEWGHRQQRRGQRNRDQVLLPASQTGLLRDAKAQAEQVRSVPVERVEGRLGQLPAGLIADLDRALRVQLSL